MANQSEIVHLLKERRKFMCIRDIQRETGDSLTSLTRKLNRLCPWYIEKKMMKVERANKLINLTYFRFNDKVKRND